MTHTLIAVTIASLVFSVFGCCKKNDPKKGAEQTTQPSDKVGLNDPSNDPEIVKAAKTVSTCKWTLYGYDSQCEELKKWRELAKELQGLKDATYVNFLSDSNTRVQYLGLYALENYGTGVKTDKAMAAKMLEYVEKTTDPINLKLGAKIVGHTNLTRTEGAKRVMDLLQDTSKPELRVYLTENTLFSNKNVPGMYDLFVKLAKSDKDIEVRRHASSALWIGTPSDRNTQTCNLWLELSQDPDDELSGHAAYLCAFWTSGSSGGCKEQWDALLTIIDTKVKGGKLKSSRVLTALGYLNKQKDITDTQKKRSIDILKNASNNEANDASTRVSALRIISEHDPNGKAFVKKFTTNKDSFIANSAKRIIEK